MPTWEVVPMSMGDLSTWEGRQTAGASNVGSRSKAS